MLAGLSAGAMCWFEGGVSKSGGMPEAVSGIGLLPGSLSVHMDSEPERLPVYFEAVGGGRLPPGFAADDGAALVFRGLALQECVASRPDARVVRVAADASVAGGVSCSGMPVRVLPGAAGGADGAVGSLEAHGVAELRELRAGPRRRWD